MCDKRKQECVKVDDSGPAEHPTEKSEEVIKKLCLLTNKLEVCSLARAK